jgi:hypothetical protein
MKRTNKQNVFPIFCHVNPSDVRHQRNSYEKAMDAHQNKFGKDSEKIKAWAAALSEVADFKGHHIHTGYVICNYNSVIILSLSCQKCAFIFFRTL